MGCFGAAEKKKKKHEVNPVVETDPTRAPFRIERPRPRAPSRVSFARIELRVSKSQGSTKKKAIKTRGCIKTGQPSFVCPPSFDQKQRCNQNLVSLDMDCSFKSLPVLPQLGNSDSIFFLRPHPKGETRGQPKTRFNPQQKNGKDRAQFG